MHLRRPSSTPWVFAISLLATCPSIGCKEDEPLEQLPLSAALDYVHRHPEYFIADPAAEVIRGEPPRGADAELDRHLAGDWVARQLATGYRGVDVDDRISWAHRSVELTQEALVSQRSPEIFKLAGDCTCDPGFSDAAFARLVRGFSNCDGVNHVLAMLLFRREPKTRLRHLDLGHNSDPYSGHTLAVMPGRREPIFVDAWADFGVMVLSNGTAGVPTWDEHADLGLREHQGLFDRHEYEDSRRVRHVDLDYGERLDEGPDLSIPDDLPPITDARSAYLRARVFDLYGLKNEAAVLYELAASMACVIPTATLCQLSTAFLGRIEPGLAGAQYSG